MSSDKTPMVRFLRDEKQRAQDKLDRAREHEEVERQSLNLQKQMKGMAEALGPEQRDIVDTIISIIKERGELLKWRDYYREAEHYLARAGYDYRSAVEDMPTVLRMAEHALNHRSQIQSFHERALTHLGISEEWQVRLRNGELTDFFEANPQGPGKVTVEYRKDGFSVNSEPGPADDGNAPSMTEITEEQDRETERENLEERALSDFTSAMEAVRSKLVATLGLDPTAPWEALSPALRAVANERDSSVREREAILTAMCVLREQVVKADKLVWDTLGGCPTGEAEYASDLVKSVQALISRMEENALDHKNAANDWQMEHDRLLGRAGVLESDITVLRKGDDTSSGTWKAHFLDLARAVGVPSVSYGVVTDPNVDAVMTYVGQVMPAYKLLQLVDDLEKRIDEMASPPKVTGPRTATVTQKCPFCEAVYPRGAMFCSRCGKEPASEPLKTCETCEGMPDDCFPDPPGSDSCEYYKPKGEKP